MQIKSKKLLIYTLGLSFGMMLVLTSCGSTGLVKRNGCGCGADVYKVNKLYKKKYQK